ncbi:uncharacterized protein BDZ99DRAFT_482752 [Mytilinidion resinicola]|uniref:Uncharacterized protein n=1 Tax=Mytilinidion resinicola TaxID=574789 RepID=A0A6A6Y234_9PEZI|nr:uncharacterized protein BDZ99DRAFT_482752 [Mytilinidion resinicola]KAF2802618.1 hypothetical protein BDZ99DRAFT_482752 [Mytilinidion resinicola]
MSPVSYGTWWDIYEVEGRDADEDPRPGDRFYERPQSPPPEGWAHEPEATRYDDGYGSSDPNHTGDIPLRPMGGYGSSDPDHTGAGSLRPMNDNRTEGGETADPMKAPLSVDEATGASNQPDPSMDGDISSGPFPTPLQPIDSNFPVGSFSTGGALLQAMDSNETEGRETIGPAEAPPLLDKARATGASSHPGEGLKKRKRGSRGGETGDLAEAPPLLDKARATGASTHPGEGLKNRKRGSRGGRKSRRSGGSQKEDTDTSPVPELTLTLIRCPTPVQDQNGLKTKSKFWGWPSQTMAERWTRFTVAPMEFNLEFSRVLSIPHRNPTTDINEFEQTRNIPANALKIESTTWVVDTSRNVNSFLEEASGFTSRCSETRSTSSRQQDNAGGPNGTQPTPATTAPAHPIPPSHDDDTSMLSNTDVGTYRGPGNFKPTSLASDIVLRRSQNSCSARLHRKPRTSKGIFSCALGGLCISSRRMRRYGKRRLRLWPGLPQDSSRILRTIDMKTIIKKGIAPWSSESIGRGGRRRRRRMGSFMSGRRSAGPSRTR